MSQVGSSSTFSPPRQPFLYLTAAVVAGILVDRHFQPTRVITSALLIASLAAAAKFTLGKRNAASTAALLLSFGFAGVLLSGAERSSNLASRLGALYDSKVISADDPVELTGTLAAPPEPAVGAYYLDLDAESLRLGDDLVYATGRARLMISPSDEEARSEYKRLALDYGSRIRVFVRLERARQYLNPGSPDFNEFLERQGCDLKGVIKSPLLIEHIGHGHASRPLAILYHLRLRTMDALDSRFNRRVAGTLKAMLVGNRYFLEPAASERLREASTFHTLSISGMHISIIAWVLLAGRSSRRRKAARVIICLGVLWAYAVMVGLEPPVTRATAMITIGLIGPLLFRRSASINSVALAAFIMLALKPALVADPGFQLSFIAVAAIAVFGLPLAEKLRRVGEWRPTSQMPHPPSCHRAIRYLAECLFWDDRAFDDEMLRSPIRYRLKKAGAARAFTRLRVQGLLRAVALLLITSAAIQISTLPLMALYFNRVAPVGVLLNVVAGLLTGVLMLMALGAIAVGPVSSLIALQLERVVNLAHYLLVNAIAPFAEIPLATFRVAHYEGSRSIVYALYFIPVAALAVLIDRWQPVDHVSAIGRTQARTARAVSIRTARPGLLPMAWIFSVLSMAAALVAVILPPAINRASGKLTVHFLDVGQGDSALVVFPRGKTMLVDGGGELRFGRQELDGRFYDGEEGDKGDSFSVGEAVVSRFIWSLGRTRVDYVLATHAHADHMGGLSDVARNLSVRQALVGHAPSSDREYDKFARTVNKYRIQLATVRAGERFEIDGVSIEVLWPPRPSGPQVTSGNDDSVVLRLISGSVSILLAGDIEQTTENSLLASGADLRADILKVPHHGSRTSSTEAFIKAVNPEYAVISVGERSRFGHPHREVVDRYRGRDIKVLQTGRDGMVTVETDGHALEVRTFRH